MCKELNGTGLSGGTYCNEVHSAEVVLVGFKQNRGMDAKLCRGSETAYNYGIHKQL